MSYEELMKAQAQAAHQAAQAEKYPDQAYNTNRAIIGGFAAQAVRPCLAMLSSSLEQAEKLAAMTTDLANRIGGSVPELSQAVGAGTERDMPSDLRSVSNAIEAALRRVEANVARAMQSL